MYVYSPQALFKTVHRYLYLYQSIGICILYLHYMYLYLHYMYLLQSFSLQHQNLSWVTCGRNWIKANLSKIEAVVSDVLITLDCQESTNLRNVTSWNRVDHLIASKWRFSTMLKIIHFGTPRHPNWSRWPMKVIMRENLWSTLARYGDDSQVSWSCPWGAELSSNPVKGKIICLRGCQPLVISDHLVFRENCVCSCSWRRWPHFTYPGLVVQFQFQLFQLFNCFNCFNFNGFPKDDDIVTMWSLITWYQCCLILQNSNHSVGGWLHW